MHNRAKLMIGAAATVAVVGIGTGVGVAAGRHDDKPIRGNDFDRATAAALEHVGEGTVTETESEGSSFEVEVRLDDGSQVEVQLDGNFEVTRSENDDDGPNDEDGAEAG